MPRSLLVLLTLTAASGTAQPGPIVPEAWQLQIDALLAAQDHAEIARGAWLAGRLGERRVAPKLVALLREHADRKRRSAALLESVLLQALIDLGGKVPAGDLLAEVSDEWLPQKLVLAGQDPKQHHDFLAGLLEPSEAGKDENVWVAVRNLLLEALSSELAPHLLEHLELRLRLVVRPAEGLGPGGIGAALGGSTFTSGGSTVPRAFPPVTLSRLTARPSTGARLLAPGRHPIFVEEHVVQPGFRGRARNAYTHIDRHAYRLEYLRDLVLKADGPHQPEMLATTTHTIRWHGAEHYVRSATAHRAELDHGLDRLLNALVDADLLDAEAALLLRPGVIVEVLDQRADRSEPLPALPATVTEPRAGSRR